MDKEFEELIRLYRNLQLQVQESEIRMPEIAVFQNINLMMGTYEAIKYQLSSEKTEEIHLAIKKKIKELIEEIKQLNKKEGLNTDLLENMTDIDLLLGNPDITDEEMNELLDKKLVQRNKRKSNE